MYIVAAKYSLTLLKRENPKIATITLLGPLKDKIAKKRPHMKNKKGMFYQDNALCHKLMKTMTELHELRFELLPYLPHFPDLATSDFFDSQNLKGSLEGKFAPMKKKIVKTEAY